MEISGAMGAAAQEMATNKAQSGFDVLTKTLQKTENNEVNEQQQTQIAEHTGKGLNINIKA
ncbi:MAG: hypothetical protein GXP51_10145 [Deltaproteobacteria bacterium]|nr:hypothetical protein [Deltaproteobacteria bacterium]